MSWGYKITIVYAVFITMILGMVYVASRQTNEMQDKNYYARELVYQEIIDGKNNLNASSEKVSISEDAGTVVIHFPVQLCNQLSDGSIYFLCPSDEKKDWKEAIRLNDKAEHRIAKAHLPNSFYTVKISWKNHGTPYYLEQNYKVN